MQQNNLFVESFISQSTEIVFGVLCLNKDTYKDAKSMCMQTMPVDSTVSDNIKSNILKNGYNKAFPIVLNERLIVTDGYTRMSACLELIASGYCDEFLVPFYTANVASQAFNSGTRGSSVSDIEYLFKIPRSGGLLTGKSARAAEQAIEASRMLDATKGSTFEDAFDSSKIQRHTSKIVRENEAFVHSFKAVCELSTSLDMNPNEIKWAHWMALFCRRGVTSTTKAIARKNLISAKGTTQEQRLNAFKECLREDELLGAL